MKNMVIDSHCDTALKLYLGNDINSKGNQFTLDNALKYDKYIQYFASYIEPSYVASSPYLFCIDLIKTIKNQCQIPENNMTILTNKRELLSYMESSEKKLGIILSIEDAICLEGKLENLNSLYNEGIRVIGLTWNGKNEVAAGVDYSNTLADGLTKFGKSVISKMNELGIIIDVSHLSQKSFYDVIKITQKPIMASHSCAMSYCNHKRNLYDEQIKIIANMGGVIGINFYYKFLEENKNEADIECLIKHIKHIYNVGGKYCIGLGSDFDGISKSVIGIEDNSKLIDLVNSLSKNGFSEEDIDNIMWKNHFEFLKRELK